jgi:hypothetical protein
MLGHNQSRLTHLAPGEVAVERIILTDSTVRFVTEKKGTDNNRSALIRFTYSLNAKSFSIKEIRYEDENQFFVK